MAPCLFLHRSFLALLLAAHRSFADYTGEQCGEDIAGQSLLQLSRGIVKQQAVSSAYCKPWCHNDAQNGGIPWDEKCTMRRCETCPECAGMTTTTTTTIEYCKPWCHNDAQNGGMPWGEKCGLQRCEECTECFTTTTTTRPALPLCQVELADGSTVDKANLLSGSSFHGSIRGPGGVDGRTFAFDLSPDGLSISGSSGEMTWQPDLSQSGEQYAVLDMTANDGSSSKCLVEFFVAVGGSNPPGIYVSPSHGSDSNAGTVDAPFASVEHAASTAAPGDIIYVRGGRYAKRRDEVVVHATAIDPVIITRLPGERVRFDVETYQIGFKVSIDSVGVTFRGLELYGSAEKDDFWEVIRTSWWQVVDTRVAGRTGFELDGQHIVVEDCVIHDFSHKAVNVYKGRYITVRNNVMYNIGHTSLSGGTGVMRQWERTFKTPDDPDYFRFDMYGNLLLAVEQRVYSFVPWKAYCNLVIDEGKPIQVDTTKDTDMKARIAHNLVLYGGIDHIRVLWNPNIQVYNNAILAEDGRIDPVPDGITFKNNQTPITNASLIGNLVQSYDGSKAYDVQHHFTSADTPSHLRNNFHAGGGRVPGTVAGITDLGANASVFKDIANFDFRKSDSISEYAGVDEKILHKLMGMVTEYSVDIAPTGWRHDHIRQTQVILDNAPVEHVSNPTLAPSFKEEHRLSMWYNVTSEFYRSKCKCTYLEIILPPQYVEAMGLEAAR